VSSWSRLGGAWPSERQEILLAAALSLPEPAGDAWARWRALEDPDTTDFDSQRLLPLVFRNLFATGLDDSDRARLKDLYRTWWYRNQMLLARTGEAMDDLHAAGLETMVLKGAALGAAHYRDVGARPVGDLDLWVSPEDAPAAMHVLEAADWRTIAGWNADSREADEALRWVHGEGYVRGPAALDLHWHVLHQPAAPEDFWQHSVPVTVGSVTTRTLGPADQVVHACEHGADGATTPIRWAADVVVILRSAEVDWERLVEVAERQRLAVTLREMLGYVREVFDAPVPEDALVALRALGAPRRERRLHRAAMRPASPARSVRVFWDRYRRLALYEGRRLRPLGFPRYMRRASGFPNWPSLAAHGLGRAWQLARLRVSPGRRDPVAR
jgi:hypothetical protein